MTDFSVLLGRESEEPSAAVVLRPPRRRSARRWCTPPQRDVTAGEPDGADILEEFTDAAAFVLWQSFRDARLWAQASARDRPRLLRRVSPFLEGIEEIPELVEIGPVLVTLRCRLRSGRTRPADGHQVAACCLRVSSWASGHGAMRTALAFSFAAAAATPQDARNTLDVGRFARVLGRNAVAATWLFRAVTLARQSGDWLAYSSAWLEIGRIRVQLGDVDRARRALLRARAVAKRRHLPFARGPAEHALLRLETRRGSYEQAAVHAKAALHHMKQDHPDRPSLLHDVAHLMILTGGDPGKALEALWAALPHRQGTARIETYVLMVRAAGHAKDRTVLEESWHNAVRCIEEVGESAVSARCLLDLARAAAELLEERRADLTGLHALRMAERVNDEALVSECRDFLRRVRLHVPPPPNGR